MTKTTNKTNTVSAPQKKASSRQQVAYNVSKLFDVEAPSNAQILGYDKPGHYTPASDPNYVLREDLLTLVMPWWLMRRNREGLWLYGDTGTGKSSFFRQLCALTNNGLQHVVGHERLELQELITTILLKDGDTVAVDGPLTRAARYGHLFLLDEADIVSPATLSGLNEILRGKPITIPETGEVVKPHEMFGICFTGNSNGAGDNTGLYQGVIQQNLASSERFYYVKVDYLDPEAEKNLILKYLPILPEEMVEGLVKVANGIRKAFMGDTTTSNGNRQTCEVTMSTDKLISWAQYTSYFSNVSRIGEKALLYALEPVLTNRVSPETKAFVESLVQHELGVEV